MSRLRIQKHSPYMKNCKSQNCLKNLRDKPKMCLQENLVDEEHLLKKTRASYVFWFNFGGRFLDEKFVFQIANFQFFWNFAKMAYFSNNSENYSFSCRGLCFWNLSLDIQIMV